MLLGASPAAAAQPPAPKEANEAKEAKEAKDEAAAAKDAKDEAPLEPVETTPSGDQAPSSRARPPSVLDALGPGSILGRYEILMPVARGGMASVWAARLSGTRGFQKLVAIKTMLPDVSDDPDFVTMFLDEARVAARIRHPNVAEILDLGEQDDVLYLVMEWVEGDNLSALLKAARDIGGIPLPIVVRIATQICAGLHAAHELRDDTGNLVDLIHRDVSPANVLISTAGYVKIIDFGVAKSRVREHVTRAGAMLKGKTPYLSPEQLTIDPIDRRSDIFSLGALLYVLSTGLHPFRGDSDIKTIENITRREPISLTRINAKIPADFDKIIQKALAKDPADRYSTAAELGRALEQLASSFGTTTEEDVAAFVQRAIGESQARRAAELRASIVAVDALSPPRVGSGPDIGRKPTFGGDTPKSVRPAPAVEAGALPDLSAAEAKPAAAHRFDAMPPPPPDPADLAPSAGAPANIDEAIPPSSSVDVAASLPSGPPSEMPTPRKSKAKIVVGAVLAACALLGVVALVASTGGSGGKAPANKAEAATTSTASTPSTPVPAATPQATAVDTAQQPPPAATPEPTVAQTAAPVETAPPAETAPPPVAVNKAPAKPLSSPSPAPAPKGKPAGKPSGKPTKKFNPTGI